MWPGTTTLYIGEFNKYLAARLRAVFDAVFARGAAA